MRPYKFIRKCAQMYVWLGKTKQVDSQFVGDSLTKLREGFNQLYDYKLQLDASNGRYKKSQN